jgi:formamidopyrimidine-DNA glycosylase
MPELPDVLAYLTALEPRVVGQILVRVRVRSPFVVRTFDPPISALDGQRVRALRRVGKRIVFVFDGDLRLVVHFMIAGRFHLRAKDARLAGRNDLAAFDFETFTLVLTEASTKSRASLAVVRGDDAVDALDRGGIDPLDADFATFRAALSSENRTLKRALTDPATIDGIGNAYSDEILHAARMSPIAQTKKLDDAQWHRLYDATQSTLRLWIDRLGDEARAAFPEKVTAFRPEMAVHGKYGKPCPVCATPVRRIRRAENDWNYCARCQTRGKIIADGGLSQLLKADRPRTLDAEETARVKRDQR